MNLQALCKEAGVQFYDSELVSENGKKIYRVFITKKGGVKLDDCANLSEILSPIFDVEPPVEGEYFLEVSSAGLERKLTKFRHFVLSIGEDVKIITNDKEKITAKIIGIEEEQERILFHNDEKGDFWLEFSQIKQAKTFVYWD